MNASSLSNSFDNDKHSLLLSICYQSKYGQHEDNIYIQHQNIDEVKTKLDVDIDKEDGHFTAKLFQHRHAQTVTVSQQDFKRNPVRNIFIEPRFGRYYPAALFTSKRLSDIDPMTPIRITDVLDDELSIDTSHPLCDYETSLSLEYVTTQQYQSTDNMQLQQSKQIMDLLTGPGMQLRTIDKATDFFSDDDLSRADETIDSKFYAQTRLINHLDEAAQEHLKSIYSRLVPHQSKLLDLMSSINSHLDEKLEPKKVVGLGMNHEELSANPYLDETIVHDINQQQALPFDDDSFDIVICSLSIEYITQPVKLFDEVGRILKSGGRFIISFSNRWFPTKAIKLWNNLHDFERIGLVMEYFINASCFTDINTYSMRGLPRPVNDKHNTSLSDPIYVIWADAK